MPEPHISGEPYDLPADFFHHLRSSLLLLGCRKDVADLLEKYQDGWLSQKDVDFLMSYNCELFTLAKDRLAYLPTFKVRIQ